MSDEKKKTEDSPEIGTGTGGAKNVKDTIVQEGTKVVTQSKEAMNKGISGATKNVTDTTTQVKNDVVKNITDKVAETNKQIENAVPSN